MTTLLAIDPGTRESGYVVLYGTGPAPEVLEHGKLLNSSMLIQIDLATLRGPLDCVIEGIACYGRPVGAEVFQTCLWSGRFFERWWAATGTEPWMLYRKQVKAHLCPPDGLPDIVTADGKRKRRPVNDATIRQALIDRYGPGKAKAIGLKASPGPLYGVKKDAWAALALGVTWLDTRGQAKGTGFPLMSDHED